MSMAPAISSASPASLSLLRASFGFLISTAIVVVLLVALSGPTSPPLQSSEASTEPLLKGSLDPL